MINYLELLSHFCLEFEQRYNHPDSRKMVRVIIEQFRAENDMVLNVKFNDLIVFSQRNRPYPENVNTVMAIYNDMARRMISDMVFSGIRGLWDGKIELVKLNKNII